MSTDVFAKSIPTLSRIYLSSYLQPLGTLAKTLITIFRGSRIMNFVTVHVSDRSFGEPV